MNEENRTSQAVNIGNAVAEAECVAYLRSGTYRAGGNITEATKSIMDLWERTSAAITTAGKIMAKTVRATMGAYMTAQEFKMALRLAEAHNRPLVSRYRHTKKKRIRKKYEKRIRAWYREVVLKCLD
jgi:dsRNA-specific ribonuclease